MRRLRMVSAETREAFRRFISLYKVELVLFLGAFALRGFFVVCMQMFAGADSFVSHADSYYFYYQTAKNLVAHHAFSLAETAPFFPGAYHTPLYPLFVAGFLVFDAPLVIIALVQSLFSAGTVVCVYAFARRLFDTRIAFWAALLVLIEPISIYWGGMLMSDALFSFLFMLTVVLLAYERPYSGMAVLGLAALTRPIAMYFAPFFICFIAYQAYRGRARRDAVNAAMLSMIIFALVISPWLVRNKVVFDTWALTSASWYQVYSGPIVELGRSRGVPITHVSAPVIESLKRLDFTYEDVFKDAVLTTIARDPIGYGIVHIKRSLYSLVSNRYDYLVHSVFAPQLPGLYATIPSAAVSIALSLGFLFWPAVYLLCIAALLSRNRWEWWVLFVVLFGVNTVLSGAINPHGAEMSRYALGFYIFYFTFAAVGIRELWRWCSWIAKKDRAL